MQMRSRQEWIRGRREKRQLARKTRLRRQIARFTLLALLVFAGASAFIYLPWRLVDLGTQVTIRGNQVTADNQVKALLKCAVGQPLYKLNPRALERLLCTLPTVRYAFVRRHALPVPGLDVQVLEEFPWASFAVTPDAEPDAVIAESGRIIPVKEFPKVVRPQLKFCGASGFKMTPADVAHWDFVVRLVGEQIGQPVSLVDMRQPTKIAVYCGGLELHVGQDDSSLIRRLKRLDSVLPAALALKQNLKYVDLSLDSNVPLKLERGVQPVAKDTELLRDAMRALASNEKSINDSVLRN